MAVDDVMTLRPFSPERAVEDALETYYGLKQYVYITTFIERHPFEIAISSEFQRVFSSYYRVRLSLRQRKAFFKVFQEARDRGIRSFPMLLDMLFERIAICEGRGRVETSFVSKMLASLDDSCPIWDSRVTARVNELGDVQLRNPSNFDNPHKRLEVARQSYALLQTFYAGLLLSEEGKECVRSFDELLPSYKHISNVKKIDCLLWGSGPIDSAESISVLKKERS